MAELKKCMVLLFILVLKYNICYSKDYLVLDEDCEIEFLYQSDNKKWVDSIDQEHDGLKVVVQALVDEFEGIVKKDLSKYVTVNKSHMGDFPPSTYERYKNDELGIVEVLHTAKIIFIFNRLGSQCFVNAVMSFQLNGKEYCIQVTTADEIIGSNDHGVKRKTDSDAEKIQKKIKVEVGD